MIRFIIFSCLICSSNSSLAVTILVQNLEQLHAANASARPGDTVVLKNGTWNNVVIRLNCSGTQQKPVVFKAQQRGKVIISGISQLRLGGNYIIVEGLLFANGYSAANTVIDFKISNSELANNCRVTNCVINDFNKPQRMKDDSWISMSGKNNRLDHCSFLHKKNLGVLLAVLLDDERSRENFHSIDHNYFGIRMPLASNGGEIIRVGLSQHSQFNSNTRITENVFEHCDGEAEIISIKSAANLVSNNVFRECQGSVVLRHGDRNTVTNNLFFGNGKEGTGGVRIVNGGQWVINNFFYKCRGESFRAPLVLMNGVPNSPPTRYVRVTDAVIMNNSFVDCSPMSFCEGSDKERTLTPSNVLFAGNIFYNRGDSLLYQQWDDISGIRFVENKITEHFGQKLVSGFETASFTIQKIEDFFLPNTQKSSTNFKLDSLVKIDYRKFPKLNGIQGFSDPQLLRRLLTNAYSNCGANWFKPAGSYKKPVVFNCKTVSDIYNSLSKGEHSVILNLEGTGYSFTKPVLIHGDVQITSSSKTIIELNSQEPIMALFVIKGKAFLSFKNLKLSAKGLKARSFIATDTSGSPEHYSLKMENVSLENPGSCKNMFYAYKSSLADSIVVRNCRFTGVQNGFLLADEQDNKGYYGVEKVVMVNNYFSNGKGILLDLYRGGSDESTLGPDLAFANNRISNYSTSNTDPLIQLTGVQKTRIGNNSFTDCNIGKTLILYKDAGRASHLLSSNALSRSGTVQKNDFVVVSNNKVQ